MKGLFWGFICLFLIINQCIGFDPPPPPPGAPTLSPVASPPGPTASPLTDSPTTAAPVPAPTIGTPSPSDNPTAVTAGPTTSAPTMATMDPTLSPSESPIIEPSTTEQSGGGGGGSGSGTGGKSVTDGSLNIVWAIVGALIVLCICGVFCFCLFQSNKSDKNRFGFTDEEMNQQKSQGVPPRGGGPKLAHLELHSSSRHGTNASTGSTGGPLPSSPSGRSASRSRKGSYARSAKPRSMQGYGSDARRKSRANEPSPAQIAKWEQEEKEYAISGPSNLRSPSGRPRPSKVAPRKSQYQRLDKLVDEVLSGADTIESMIGKENNPRGVNQDHLPVGGAAAHGMDEEENLPGNYRMQSTGL